MYYGKFVSLQCELSKFTMDVFYVSRVVYLVETAKVNAYTMYTFGKIELLSIIVTYKLFKMYYLNDFQKANTYLYMGHWKYGRNMTFMDLVSDRTLETIA